MPRYLNKRCLRLLGAELHFSRRTGAVVLWLGPRKYTVRRPRIA